MFVLVKDSRIGMAMSKRRISRKEGFMKR